MCLQVGVLGQANRGKHLGGKVKDLLIKEVGIVAGMMNPVTRTVTPGTTITSKMTGNYAFFSSKFLIVKNILYIHTYIYR